MKNNKCITSIIRISAVLSVIVAIFCGCASDVQNRDVEKADRAFSEIESAYLEAESDAESDLESDADNCVTDKEKPTESEAEIKEDTSLSSSQDSSQSHNEEVLSDGEVFIEQKQQVCTMTVRCDEILSNLDKLDESKHNLIPKDGIIFSSQSVEFSEGESAFDVLRREMKNNNIHMEFEYTPGFKSYYVEGIGNLYEFDCGNMSGWIYKLNGKFASVGCSQYILKPGDVIEWIYTC
ncbi:MAG: DUF4430 domain-containing protein [Clostridia bacterium]|nr:DUF4430 domain-containing protein [Clostridia bacterium]